jgi:hypothetical protein
MTDKLLLALAATVLALTMAVASTPPATYRADSIVPMNHWHAPVEASACNVG